MEKGKLLDILKYAKGKVAHPEQPQSYNNFGYINTYPNHTFVNPAPPTSESVIKQAEDNLVSAKVRAEKIRTYENFVKDLDDAIAFLEVNNITFFPINNC